MTRIAQTATLCAIATVTGATGVRAQEIGSPPLIHGNLSLRQAEQLAARYSPELAASAADADSARAVQRQEQSMRRPAVSLNTFASGGSNANIVSSPAGIAPPMLMTVQRGAFLDQNITIMAPLTTGGRLRSAIHAAQNRTAAANLDETAQRNMIVRDVRIAYRELEGKSALLKVSADRLDATTERQRVDVEKFNAGAVPQLTVNVDEAQTAAAKQQFANALRDVQLASLQLSSAMGIDGASDYTISEPLPTDSAGAVVHALLMPTLGAPLSQSKSSDIAQLQAVAAAQRPELAAQRARKAAARSDVSAAKAQFGPRLDAFAMGDFMSARAGAPAAGATFGIAASLALTNGGQRHAATDAASALDRREQARLRRAELQVNLDVDSALLNLSTADKNVSTAETAVTSAVEAYRVAQERYQAGRSIHVELLEALAARTTAQSDLVTALVQRAEAADQLRYAVGAPPL